MVDGITVLVQVMGLRRHIRASLKSKVAFTTQLLQLLSRGNRLRVSGEVAEW